MTETATFTCASCRQTFDKGRSDEEALAERDALWAEEADRGEAFALVCEDCFKAFMLDHKRRLMKKGML